AQVPTVEADNSRSYAYAGMYLEFHDKASGLNFWYGAAFFDHRANVADEFIGYEPSTNSGIVAAVVGANGQFSTSLAGSSGFQSTAWTGFKHFEFAITATDMKHAIAALKARFPAKYAGLSKNPSHYTITEVNVTPEVATFGKPGEIGLSIQNMNVSLE